VAEISLVLMRYKYVFYIIAVNIKLIKHRKNVAFYIFIIACCIKNQHSVRCFNSTHGCKNIFLGCIYFVNILIDFFNSCHINVPFQVQANN